MVATCAHDLDARRRRLEELFEDQPYLSPTMKASRLHERQPAAEAVTLERPWPDFPVHRAGTVTEVPVYADAGVTRLGLVVRVKPHGRGFKAEVRAEDGNDVMTSREAARFMRIGLSTLRKLVNENGLPCTKIGRSRRFRRTAVLRWMKAQERA